MKIGILAQQFAAEKRPLQPWCYYDLLRESLEKLGHETLVFTDAKWAEEPRPAWLRFVPDARLRPGSRATVRALNDSGLDHLVIPLTRSSFAYLRRDILSTIRVRKTAFFPGPIASLRELTRAGIAGAKELRFLRNHLAGCAVPLARGAKVLSSCFNNVVTMGQTDRELLLRFGLSSDAVTHLPFGRTPEMDSLLTMRRAATDGSPFVYFGAPLGIRGLWDAVAAANRAHEFDSRIRLLCLARSRQGEYEPELRRLRQSVSAGIELQEGFLDRRRLLEIVSTSAGVVLPFRIVQSGIPVALLETQAMGVPLLTTDVPIIRDYISPDAAWISKPGDVPSLATNISHVRTSGAGRASRGREELARLPDWLSLSKRWQEGMT